MYRQTKEQKKLERRVVISYRDQMVPELRIHEYRGRYAPYDFYLFDNDRPVELIEVKTREKDIASTTYPTVWVSLAKWTKLLIASQSFDVRGIFLFWYPRDSILKTLDVQAVFREPGSKLIRAGRTGRGATNDLEPMIDVPPSLLVAAGIHKEEKEK